MPSVPVLQLAIFSHCLVASAIREFDQKSFQVLQVDAQPRSDGILPCTSASTLTALLLQLGIPEEELKNPHEMRGITSDGCQVTGIDFRGRELHGTLPQELGELPELKMLNLAESKVTGDLSALEKATKLQGLYLSVTAVAGNLESLEKATKLQRLYLEGTAVAGNLASLEKATELQQLYLSGTAVAGNLKSLEKATKLQRLDLRGTAVAGNLKSLEQSTKLQRLYLGGTAVAGNLKSLEQSTKLQGLDLSVTAVAGNLKSLEKATKLRYLDLEGTAVAGNLGSLEKATELQQLYLSGTAVAGNLKGLEKATELQKLDLEGTAVAGNLEALEKARKLQYLDLSGTAVAGNLKSLEQSTKLQWLYLAGMAVAGNLKSLEKAMQLERLDLRGTAVAGHLSVLLRFAKIKVVDLGRTQVHGSLSEAWRGGCPKLRSLTLSDTLATFLPANDDLQELWKAEKVEKALLPDLQYLEVNNILMNGLAEHFLTMLSECPSLSTIKASNCSLKGTVPNLAKLDVKVDDLMYAGRISSLSESLQNLDLGANDISEVSSLPMKIQSLSLAKMNTGVHFQKGVLRDASSKKILLDLSGVRLMNSSEAADMLQREELRSTSQFSMIDKANGFQCKDLEGSSLRVTPHMFLPHELCQCLVGWIGTGAACQKCPKDTFRDAEVLSTADACTPCPLNSTSKEASGTLMDCQCNLGHLFQMGEEWRCGCQLDHALVEDACDKCELLHLDCMKNGSQASTAPAKEGYARLAPKEPRAFKCYPPLERCNATRSGVRDEVGCNKGYSGILCSECGADYRKDGDRCKECPKNLNSWWFIWVGLILMLVVGLVVGLAVALRRGAEVQDVAPPSAIEAAKDLAMAQAPILLQSCQLWPVLAHLARSVKTDTTEPSEMWWMKYIEVLQFSAETFKGSLNLQCHHDGRTVRFMFAVLGPVLPLLVMMACMLMEKFQKGAGLRTALKVLTLTYIGGAAACSNLLPCQNFDADGLELPESFTFRKHLPSIKCNGGDASMRFYVDTVAYATGLFYAIVIPGFLAYLFAKTQFMLRPARTSVAVASDRHELKVSMSKIIDSSDLERDAAERRLVASTMAYIAVVVRGRVRIQLLRDELTVHVKPVEGQSHRLDQDGLESADSFDLPFAMEEVTVATALKCRGISEMLMERCILEEVEDSDRILAGAKQLLLKYAQGSYLCMEILLKLAAVAVVTLVQTVQDESAVKLCVGVTLATAATIGLAQPYLQPQLNSLQVVCFTSLSISGLGFACGQVWLSQIALFLPFIVAGWQLMTPDSSQSLAVRLWNEAKKQIPKMQKGEEIEVIAEIFTFR